MSFGGAKDFGDSSAGTFGAGGAGTILEDDKSPPKNAQEMMGPGGGGTGGTSFLGRFSKGIDLSTMKEKTRAASASLSDKTKAASASLSGKMSSIGNTLMSVAKKTEEAVAPQSPPPPASSDQPPLRVPAEQRNLPPPGQLRCFACAMLMAYPDGVQQVKCPGCGTVNNTPPADSPAGMGASHIGVIHVSCLGCGCRLQMPSNAPAVSCPRCTMITQAADPRANASSSAIAAPQHPQPPVSSAVPPSAALPNTRVSAQSEDKAIEEAIRRSLGHVPTPVVSEASQERSQGLPVPPAGMAGSSVVDDTERAVAVSAVSDITGCDADVAVFLLEANRWQVEAAVNQFLETGMGADMPDAAVPPTTASKSADAHGPTSEPLFIPTPLAEILDDDESTNASTRIPIPVAYAQHESASASRTENEPTALATPQGMHAAANLLDLDPPVHDANVEKEGALHGATPAPSAADDLLGIFAPSPPSMANDREVEQVSAEDLLGLPEETSQSQPIVPVRQAQAPAEDLLLGLRDAVPVESAGKILDGPQPAEDLLLGLPQSLPCSQVLADAVPVLEVPGVSKVADQAATAEELLGLESPPPALDEGQAVVVATAPDPEPATVDGGAAFNSEQTVSNTTQPVASMTDVPEWQGLEPFMESIALGKYTEVLRQQELTDPESLSHITDDDLKELNITIGARRKLLAAIRRLQGQ